MDYNELQLRAATDAQFRTELLADPAAVLAREGIEIPEGVNIRVVESTPDTIVLAIPPQLAEGVEIDEDALSETAAGSTPGCFFVTAGLVALGGITAKVAFGGPAPAHDYSRRSG